MPNTVMPRADATKPDATKITLLSDQSLFSVSSSSTDSIEPYSPTQSTVTCYSGKLEVVATGTTAIVYHLNNATIGHIALKCLQYNQMLNETSTYKLLLNAAPRLPGILKPISYGSAQNTYKRFFVITLPYATQVLSCYLKHIHELDNAPANRKARYMEINAIFNALLVALDTLSSANIAHRDIKPANIVYSNGHWCLTDLGSARTYTQYQWGKTDSGTPLYNPPEYFAGDKRYPFKADIWATGIVLAELIGLEHPLLTALSNSEINIANLTGEALKLHQKASQSECLTNLDLSLRKIKTTPDCLTLITEHMLNPHVEKRATLEAAFAALQRSGELIETLSVDSRYLTPVSWEIAQTTEDQSSGTQKKIVHTDLFGTFSLQARFFSSQPQGRKYDANAKLIECDLTTQNCQLTLTTTPFGESGLPASSNTQASSSPLPGLPSSF